MDFGTITAECISEIGQSTAGTIATINVKQAICEAVNFNGRLGPFAWQEKVTLLNLKSGDLVVPLPEDFARAIGEIYYVKSDSPLNRHTLKLKSFNEVASNNSYLTNAWSNQPTAFTKVCAIDFATMSLVMTPSAEDDDDYIELRYQRKGRPPIPQYVSAAWVFNDPYTGKAITDNWTNEWFTDGRYLTKLRAMYILWTRWYGGTDGAAAKAQIYLQQWTEEINKLYGQNAKMASPRQVARFL